MSGSTARAPRYKRRVERVRHSRQAQLVARLESKGWELESEDLGKRRNGLTFRKERRPRWVSVVAAVVAVAIVAGLPLAYTQLSIFHDAQWQARRDASAAVGRSRRLISAR